MKSEIKILKWYHLGITSRKLLLLGKRWLSNKRQMANGLHLYSAFIVYDH